MRARAILLTGVLVLLLLFIFALNPIQSLTINPNETAEITNILAYKSGTLLDTDDNGLELITGGIDFTLEQSVFTWNVTESELCSLWDIHSVENSTSEIACTGNEICCNRANVLLSKDATILNTAWDSFVLIYSQFGSTYNNNVSAQILYFENTSDYIFSDWKILPARFSENEESAVVLESPSNNMLTNHSPVDFVYSPQPATGNNSLSNCSLIVNNQIFATENNPALNQANQFTALSEDGIYNWSVECSDMNGNKGVSEGRKLTVDTAPPQLYILSPENSASISTGSGINITYSVSDLISPYQKCSLYLDGALTRAATISNSVWIETFSSLPLGIHTFSVNCTDEAENTAVSEVRSFSISSLEILVASSSYSLNSSVPLVINAPESAIVRLIVTRYDLLNKAYVESYYDIAGPYPRVFQFNDTEFSGTYTAKASINTGSTTMNSTASFEIGNSLTADIYSKSLAGVSEALTFNASAYGGVSPYSYIWNFDDNTGNASGSYVTHSFTNTGTYDVTLYLRDSFGNTNTLTKSVSINYLIQVYVRNTNSNPIENAEVTFDGITKYTNETGYAPFYELEGTYHLRAKAQDYLTHDSNIFVNASTTILINLTLDLNDLNAPILQVIGPGNNEAFTSSPITFSFYVDDESDVNCSLLVSQDNSWWTPLMSIAATKGTEQTMDGVLQDGNYSWRIECMDSKGNSILSQIRNISVTLPYDGISNSLSAEIDAQGTDLDNSATEADIAISTFESFDKDRADAAEALGLYAFLDEAKKAFTNAKRDLFDLKFRRVSEEEMEALRQEILQKIENLNESLPQNVFVLQKAEYVQYPSKEDINVLATEYISIKNISLKKQDKTAYLKFLEGLQSTLVVTTKVMIVDVEYKQKAKETYTVVIKSLQLTNSSNAQFVETIPKSVASSASEIHSTHQFSVLKNDPILKFEMPENDVLSYYFIGTKELSSMQGIKSVLIIEPSMQQLKTTQVTGFVIFPFPKVFTLDMSESKEMLLVIAVIVLGAIYLIYALNLTELLVPSRKKEHQKEHRMRSLITKAETALSDGSLEEAAMFYTEIKLLYSTLDAEIGNEFYGQLESLCKQMNIKFAEKTLSQITEALALGKMKEAMEFYPLLEEAYQKLPEAEKTKIAPHCVAIHQQLSEVMEHQEV